MKKMAHAAARSKSDPALASPFETLAHLGGKLARAGLEASYSGLLERIRFAVDPRRNDFFFGPLD